MSGAYEAPVPFWKSPEHPGTRRTYETPAQLWADASEYFQWIADHPLQAQEVFHHKGHITKTMVSKARPMTLMGLCSFLGITLNTYKSAVAQVGFDEVRDLIDQVIYTQKFEGAAAGFFNASIINRDLGLAEKTELSGPGGGPVRTITSDMSPQEAAEAYAATLSGDQG